MDHESNSENHEVRDFPTAGVNFYREVSCTRVYTIHDLILNREVIIVHVGPSYNKVLCASIACFLSSVMM